ncbi:hypothetical protein F511_21873 [Dorcoceras hygrometricum]|uniref:Uncharacterized protein n=1 Tax=Dorcoceras hygrometricum TaxID=472368 RepID=A0A2Z7AH16_9LAMI|nr:hypothetical protein F511_21873 [Dorcoceras hygrometricum]
MDSFTIAGPTSGPDLNYTYSYTSILRLGLAAGDTPGAPITPRDPRTEHYGISLTYTIGGESNQATRIELELGIFNRGLATRSGIARAPSLWRKAYNLRRQPNSYLLSFALARTADLSIGGASPDTLPAPSDERSLVAGIRTYSPVPDVRRARGP